MSSNQVYIYGLFDPRSMELRYVGKSINPERRLKEHLKEVRNNESNCHKDNWIRQLLSENLTPSMEILEECTQDNWQEIEIAWIKECREKGLELTNSTNGGEGVIGHSLSDEHKRKISEAQKGKIVSEETKTRMSKAFKGRIFSEEHRRKIGDVHRGKTISDEHIEIIRQSNLGNQHALGHKHTNEAKKKMSESQSKRTNHRRGFKHSSETIEKLRIASTGKTLSKEARKKVSDSKIGKPRSAETKAKLRLTNLGKKHSAETKAKMSKSQRERRLKNKVTI